MNIDVETLTAFRGFGPISTCAHVAFMALVEQLALVMWCADVVE